MKAVFLDYRSLAAQQLDESPLLNVLPRLRVFPGTAPDELPGRLAQVECVLVNKVRLDAETLRAATALKFIGLAATGTDNVDLEVAAERGIAIANARDYCTRSVVEHVFGVLLTLAHNLHRYHRDTRQGDWQRSASFSLLTHPLRELSAMTMGIVGHGTLGSAVAAMARTYGMNVVIARRRDAGAAEGDGRMDFDELLETADVVSLHCPLNATTENLVAAEELERMKPDAFLINTARGGLVDAAALARALEAGAIGGAAIDVLAEEPPTSGNPLLDYRGDNLVITPHIAWATAEARQNVIRELAANVESFLSGGRRNRVI